MYWIRVDASVQDRNSEFVEEITTVPLLISRRNVDNSLCLPPHISPPIFKNNFPSYDRGISANLFVVYWIVRVKNTVRLRGYFRVFSDIQFEIRYGNVTQNRSREWDQHVVCSDNKKKYKLGRRERAEKRRGRRLNLCSKSDGLL